jgi:hypothetical protein
MACTNCENFSFTPNSSVVVSIQKSGSNALLYVQNQGKNAVEIRRILLCYYQSGGGTVTWYLRAAPQQITWTYPLTYLEQGITALFYQLNSLPAGTIVQAQAEYIEFDGRSKSCSQTI